MRPLAPEREERFAMAPAPRAPRMSQWVVALCVSMRASGKSFRKIAEHHLIKKRDGTDPTHQAVEQAVQAHKTARLSAKWRLNGAGKRQGSGPKKKITKAQVKEMEKLIKKSPGVVRAPYLKKKLKLKCCLKTVQRAVASLGYKVYRRGSKKVLSKRTKKLRLKWAEEHEARTRLWWRNRGYADGHYWYMPWKASAPRPKGTSVLRKKGQGAAPKHQGGKGGEYKQGKRIGVWGVLTTKGLGIFFLPKGRLTSAVHAATVQKRYAAWAGWAQGIVHDGERALWAPAAKRAYEDVGLPPMKSPPQSPDMNPIENAWALLDRRLETTAPGGFETEKVFRVRVRAAVRWLNTSKLEDLKRLVGSMPSRVQAVLASNGAMTKY